MEVSLRMTSLPLPSWAVTILRMEGSVVWDWDMILLDERSGDSWVESEDRRDEFNSLIYSPWWNLSVNLRNRHETQ